MDPRMGQIGWSQHLVSDFYIVKAKPKDQIANHNPNQNQLKPYRFLANLYQNRMIQTQQMIQNQILASQKQEIAQLTKQWEELHKLSQLHNQQLDALKEQAKKLQSPEFYQKGRKKCYDKFIQNISNVSPPIIDNKIRKKFIIGPISAGKSSVLNYFLGTNVEVGRGQTTTQVKEAYTSQSKRFNVYDSPGINHDHDIINFDNLIQLFVMNEFYVCYNDSLKSVELILRVLSAISSKNGQSIFLVRTQCDRFTQNDMRSLKEELQVDREYLNQLKKRENQKGFNFQKINIIATSVKRDMDFEDNQKLYDLLMQEPQSLHHDIMEKMRKNESNGDLF